MSIEIGTELPAIERTATVASSVRYAGASGDFNPLHYDPGFAAEVSPTGAPIAHGMYSMGLASAVLTAFAGGPEHVIDLQVRFPRPWPLGATATFSGTVTGIDAGVATVSLVGTTEEGKRVLKGTGRVRI